MISVAIDLGAQRTKLAMYDRRAKRSSVAVIIPTVVYVPRQGAILVGGAAVEAIKTDPTGGIDDLKDRLTSGTCLRNRRQCQPQELLAMLFAETRKQALEKMVKGDGISGCTVLIPLKFDLQQSECLKQAAIAAGFESVQLLDESLASVHFIEQQELVAGDSVVLCDLGSSLRASLLLRKDSVWTPALELFPPAEFTQDESGFPKLACDTLLQLQSRLSEKEIQNPPLLIVGGGVRKKGIQAQMKQEGWLGEILLPESAEFGGVLGAVEKPADAEDLICPVCEFFPVKRNAKACSCCGHPASLMLTKTCPDCKTENPPGTETCRECGFPFHKFQ